MAFFGRARVGMIAANRRPDSSTTTATHCAGTAWLPAT